MQKIEWNDSLSIGVDVIDEQHKMLIQHLTDIGAAIEMHQGEARISETLSFMVDYTDFHFAAEEQQMAEKDYAGLADQQAQHAEFKRMLRQLVEDFEEEGATKALATSINVFLGNWLVKHIQGIDMQFGRFLAE